MRLLLFLCALFVVFVSSVNGQQNQQAPLFPPPQLNTEPILAPADYETSDETTEEIPGEKIAQPFQQTESHVMPAMDVPFNQMSAPTQPLAHQQQMPRRRQVYRRYYTYNDPHQVEYYSPNLPYYDPAHGYNSYRPLPANSRHYRGPTDRHNTGWGFSY